MECFKILNIEPTDNIKEIKKAYSSLLKKYHPEEYPEEFTKIHQAYVDALAYAKNKDEITQNLINDHLKDNIESNHEEVLEEKFKLVENYERVYTEKEEQIHQYIQMIIDEYKKSFGIQKKWYTHPTFIKYRYDSLFIQQYIRLIDSGLYDKINVPEKKFLKKIHKKHYFYNRKSKKEYKELYMHLKSSVYKRQPSIIFVMIMFFLVFLGSLGDISFLLFQLFLIFLYLFSEEKKHQKNQIIVQFKKFVYYFVPIFIIGNFIVMIINRPTFETEYLSKGNYHVEVNDVDYIQFKQIDGKLTIINEKNDTLYIRNQDQAYQIPFSNDQLGSMGYEGDDCYYINDQGQLFNTKSQIPIFSVDGMYQSLHIISNDKYCLVFEENNEEHGKEQLYQIEDNQIKLLYEWNGDIYIDTPNSIYENKLCLIDNNLYYMIKNEKYVWCYNLETGENKKTDIDADELEIINSVGNQMFLKYIDNAFLVDHSYEFHDEVIFFTNINDKYFAYVNNQSYLYVVDYQTMEEIAIVPLESEEIHYYSILSLGGSEKAIGISLFDKRIDVILE